MANKFIGEVDAGEFGEGFTIRLDMDGQARLETEHGEFDFVQKVQIGLAVLSSKYLRSFLSVSLRDGSGAVVKAVPDYPADIGLDVIGKKCLDAFTLFRYGMDSETWKAEADKKKAEASTANPTKGTKA